MKRDFSRLMGRQFDLLVCGGGIYGAWSAYDAALRGLDVALVEQGDWAAATSSASSKLIHGGLRYLETYDFKLVRKALAERQMLLSSAPHRVWPLRFGVPVFSDSRIGALQLKAGLTLYDFLAGWPGPELAHRHHNRQSFAEHFPALDTHNLKSGFTYGDAQTDDARLVLELVAGAIAAGAVCVNYCKLTDLIETNGQAVGASVQDQLSGSRTTVRARQIVNTTGRWANTPHRLTRGIHLVMPPILTDEALLLTAPSDGRVFFMIPWYGMTLIGTTDTDYNGSLENLNVDPEEVTYLLDAANRYLNTAWTERDVVGRYAGLRVMKKGDASSPSDASRDWELHTAPDGVHYSIGGKITSAREDVACIIDTACARLDITAPCATRNRPFPWAPDKDYESWATAVSAQALRLGIDPDSCKWLMRRHGKRVSEVLRIIIDKPDMAEKITPALPLIYADLLFCARSEMVVHLDDLLRRRMPLLILARLAQNELRDLAAAVADEMGWNGADIEREIARCLPQ